MVRHASRHVSENAIGHVLCAGIVMSMVLYYSILDYTVLYCTVLYYPCIEFPLRLTSLLRLSVPQIPEPLLLMCNSACRLKVQTSQGLGPFFQIELLKADRMFLN